MYQSPCCPDDLLRKFESFGVFECERCHRTYPIDEILDKQKKPKPEQEKHHVL